MYSERTLRSAYNKIDTADTVLRIFPYRKYLYHSNPPGTVQASHLLPDTGRLQPVLLMEYQNGSPLQWPPVHLK